MMKNKKTDIFNIVVYVLLTLFCLSIVFPLWNMFVLSLNEGVDAMKGDIYLWPRKFTLDNYKTVFENMDIVTSIGISAARTAIGTTASLLVTAMLAYVLSKKNFIGRGWFISLGLGTMFFNAGLIPNFILMKQLSLLDNFLIFILPYLVFFYYALIFMAFFREIPGAIEESAKIDGANELQIFYKIILPMSKAPVATIALFIGVFHWNDYFSGILYIIRNTHLQPVQTYIYRMIMATTATSSDSFDLFSSQFETVTSKSIQLSTMFIATLPIIVVYPLVQRHLVKGMMIGSVKG